MRAVTRLRYVATKDADRLVEYTNALIKYRIEIKGNPTFVKGKWYLWFILPEGLDKEMPSGNID